MLHGIHSLSSQVLFTASSLDSKSRHHANITLSISSARTALLRVDIVPVNLFNIADILKFKLIDLVNSFPSSETFRAPARVQIVPGIGSSPSKPAAKCTSLVGRVGRTAGFLEAGSWSGQEGEDFAKKWPDHGQIRHVCCNAGLADIPEHVGCAVDIGEVEDFCQDGGGDLTS